MNYLVRETKAASGYMLSEKIMEFQFEYKDEKTPLIKLTYDPVNDSNRVQIKNFLGIPRNIWKVLFCSWNGKMRFIKENAKGELKAEKVWIAVETWTTGKQSHLLKGLQSWKISSGGDQRTKRIYKVG